MTAPLPFIVRPMAAHDIPAVVNIDRIVFTDPWPESFYVQELYRNPQARYFVLQLADHVIDQHQGTTRNDGLIGFAGMRAELNSAHISTLGVHPHWQQRGLGEMLLCTILRQALDEALPAATLEVRQSNTAAQYLYAKYEFTDVTRLRNYYDDGEAALVMRASPLDQVYRQRMEARYAQLMRRIEAHGLDMSPTQDKPRYFIETQSHRIF